MKTNTATLYFVLLCTFILTSCATTRGSDDRQSTQPLTATQGNNPSSPTQNPALWQERPETVWTTLQHTPINSLAGYQSSNNPTVAGWAKLAMISKTDSTDTATLSQKLMTWRNQYPSHPGNALFPNDAALDSLAKTAPPQRITLLLPLQGKYAASGMAVKDGFLNAYYANMSKAGPQQNISFIDTNTNPNIAALYQEAVNKGADMIIGPLTKEQVKQLMGSTSFNVPTIALNYTDTGWLNSLPSNFYQFGLSPLDEAKQVADKAWAAGRSQAIIIAPKTEWGDNAVKALSDRWKANGGSISDTYYFTDKSDLSKDIANLLHINTKEDIERTRDKENRAELEQQRRQDFDVVFLLAPPQKARNIVPLLRFYYVNKTPIYATSIVYTGTPQPQQDMDLNGVLFCDIPAVFNGSGTSNRLSAVGHDAYIISQNLQRFTVLPAFPVYAATGALTLTPQRQFYRRLAWAKMHAGHP